MKENFRKCIKCGSSSSQDASITLHRFPKPGRTNSLRCELWAQYCFPNEPWSSPEFQSKLYSQHVMLCSKHFLKTCFIDHKLFRTAVPSEAFVEGGKESQVLNDGTRSIVSAPSEPWEASRAPSGEPDVKRPRADCAAEGLDETEDVVDENPDVMDGADETGTPEDCSTTEFCRICLASEGMFYAMEGNDKLCSLYETLTGLEPAGGGLPSLVCESCAQSLLDLGRLRELARRSRDVMLRVADTHQQVTLEAIRSVEESQTVLEEHLDMDCFDHDYLSQEEIVTLTDEDTGENSENINTGSGTYKHSAKMKGTKVVRIGTNHDGVSTNDNKKHFVLTDHEYVVSDRVNSVCPQPDRLSVKSDSLQGSGTYKHSAKMKGTKVVRIGTNHEGVSTNYNKKHFVLTDHEYVVSDRTKSVCPQPNRLSVNSESLQAGRTENQCDVMGIAEDVEVKEETLEEDEAREFYLVV